MARQRSPDRDKAFEIWKASNGKKPLVEIAAELGLKDSQIRKWKSQDKWEEQLKGTLPKRKSNVTNQNCIKNTQVEVSKTDITDEVESLELTDKQRLFCHYYLKSFNQTIAAIKAGYAPDRAHITGSELVRNRKVADEIRRLKGKMTEELFVDAMDVINKYIQIAFTDITDYLTFGQREVTVMGAFGPLKDEEGNLITKVVSYVDFKESAEVDGSLISEVKQGKEGVSIKLQDKMKALEFLSKHFDLVPDRFKRQLEEEKIKIAKEKLSLDKSKVHGDDEEVEDDGFMDALKGEVEGVWDDEI